MDIFGVVTDEPGEILDINRPMSIHGKLIREITPADIWDLLNQRAMEDAFLDFKKEMFNPAKPKEKLDEDKDDIVADFVSFANAGGGHTVIGIEEDMQGRALTLNPMASDHAKRIADQLRDLAAAHIKPGIVQLEVAPFQMKDDRSKWIVMAAIPDSQHKPHMSAFRQQTRFAIRIGNRKREVAFDELQISQMPL